MAYLVCPNLFVIRYVFVSNLHLLFLVRGNPPFDFAIFAREGSARSGSVGPVEIKTAPPHQYLYVGFLSSVQVFKSWCFLQSGCQLLSSQKSPGSPRCGVI